LTEKGNKHFGKKYDLQGSESLSFDEIDITLKNTYADGSVVKPNQLFNNVSTQWQLFFHGNTHITNAMFFLDYVNKKNPQFVSESLELDVKSFRDHYANKKGNTSNDDMNLPHVHRYWDVSLD
jgi:hypothetical protein